MPKTRLSASTTGSAEHLPTRSRRHHPLLCTGTVFLTDACVILAGAFGLWIGGGTTVFDGASGLMALTFFCCAALVSVRELLRAEFGKARYRNIVDSLTDLWLICGIIALGSVYVGLLHDYFLGWLLLFASSYGFAVALVSAVITVLSDLTRWSIWPHLGLAAAGVTGIMFCASVWTDNGLLAPLTVFVVPFVILGVIAGSVAAAARRALR